MGATGGPTWAVRLRERKELGRARTSGGARGWAGELGRGNLAKRLSRGEGIDLGLSIFILNLAFLSSLLLYIYGNRYTFV